MTRARRQRRAVRAVLALVSALAVTVGCDVSRPVRAADPGVCPSFPRDIWVATDCELGLVGATVEQDACALKLTLHGQETAVIEGDLDAAGAVTVRRVEGPSTCAAGTPRGTAIHRFECTRPTTACGYDLFEKVPPAVVQIDRARVVTARFRLPASFDEGRNRLLDDKQPLEGYLAAAVVIGSGAWVATASGAYERPKCTEASTLVHVDGSSVPLRVGAPLPAPSCMRDLAHDPLDPGGFLGLSGGAAPAVHRFGRDGRLLASGAVPLPVSREPDQPVLTVALVSPTDRADPLLVVLSAEDKRLESWVIALDLATLAYQRTSEPGINPVRAASPLVRRRVFAADTASGQLIPFHVSDPGIDVPFSVNVVGGPTDDAGHVSLDPLSGELVVASTGEVPLMYFADDRESPRIRGFARFFERELLPWASAPIDGASGVMAVGLTEEAAPQRAYLARLVVAERRFVPGAVEIGLGVVRSIESDASGALWILLPWSGELVRVRP